MFSNCILIIVSLIIFIIISFSSFMCGVSIRRLFAPGYYTTAIVNIIITGGIVVLSHPITISIVCGVTSLVYIVLLTLVGFFSLYTKPLSCRKLNLYHMRRAGVNYVTNLYKTNDNKE
jgi:hypothetical protein